MGSILSRPVVHAVGMLYPAYMTFKVLRHAEAPPRLIGPEPGANNDINVDQQLQARQDHKWQQEQWLTYWLVFALFSVSEWWGDTLISWFPFYHAAKMLFIVWMQLPQTNGSRFIYKTYVEPFLIKHERSFDNTLQSVGNRALQFTTQAYSLASNMLYDQFQRRAMERRRLMNASEEENGQRDGANGESQQQQLWEVFVRQYAEREAQQRGRDIFSAQPNMDEMMQLWEEFARQHAGQEAQQRGEGIPNLPQPNLYGMQQQQQQQYQQQRWR